MTAIEYQLKLWQTRSEIQSKGVHKPVYEMIKTGALEDVKENSNYLLGRVRNEEFLNKLITFNNSL